MKCFQSKLKSGLLLSTVIIFVLCLSSCGGGSSSSGGGGVGGNQPQGQHLYVATDSQIQVFTLPITNTSTPSVVVSNPSNPLAVVMAVDSKGNLATEDFSDHIALYTAPLSSSSTPSTTFGNGASTTVEAIGFDTAGDLFAGGALDSSGTGTGVNIFKAPFSSATTPSQTVPLSGSGAFSFDGTDAAGNIYTIQDSLTLCTGQVLAPPYTGAPTTIYTAACGLNDVSGGGFIISGNQIYAIFVVSLGGFITITPAPGNSGTTTQINLPGNPGAFAVDDNGNIYVVGDNHNPTQFLVFSRPFSTNSSGSIVPTTTITVSNAKSIMSMTVGK
jgi:hypothetical protein